MILPTVRNRGTEHDPRVCAADLIIRAPLLGGRTTASATPSSCLKRDAQVHLSLTLERSGYDGIRAKGLSFPGAFQIGAVKRVSGVTAANVVK